MTLKECKEFAHWLFGWACIWLVLSVFVTWLPVMRDSTDPAWPGRSDMKPLIDNLTGCQYLVSPNGGITPRLSPNGLHFGCNKKALNETL